MQVLRTPKLWMESAATDQLAKIETLPNVKLALGMPDLHPGKYAPVGAAIFTKNTFYPHLIGNDIGCGFTVYGIEGPSPNTVRRLQLWHDSKEGETPYTIGGGNHFIEIGKGGDENYYLLVHSGSRSHGAATLMWYTKAAHTADVSESSAIGKEYLERHSFCLSWATANRKFLARQFADVTKLELGAKILDLPHNFLEHKDGLWIHRKGVNPTNRGQFLIAGSRGTVSALCNGDNPTHCAAHGCGRKYNRGDMLKRMQGVPVSELKQSSGVHVICNRKDLLYEEAPSAYKNIEDILEAQNVTVVTRIHPVINFKTTLHDSRFTSKPKTGWKYNRAIEA